MPWRGPVYPGEFPTLGWQVADWIQAHCVIPDREEAGSHFILTPEQARFLAFHYRLNPDAVFHKQSGRWLNVFYYERGSQLTRPQKWGKAPISSAIICAEAGLDSPVLFDGWDVNGEPVGKPWPTPHIQVTAVSEEQAYNVWRMLMPMIQLGPLADIFTDVGLSRINLPSGGLIEPVTASAVSRLGQRVTFCLQDQTESWLRNNSGIKLADNQRRGLAGTGGRFVETPNAYDPTEGSVAQLTFENQAPGVYKDDAPPPTGSVRNKRERHRVLQAVYGDSSLENGGWIDLDRLHAEIEALLEHDPAQAERWFLNRKMASEGAAFDPDKWAAKSRPERLKVLQKGEDKLITIGIDGASHEDAIAAVACHVTTGYIWPLCIIERPAGAGEDYKHDTTELHAAVEEAFLQWHVWRVYCDPHWIESVIESLQNQFGAKRVITWFTNRPRPIAWAVRNFTEAMRSGGELSHSGDETLALHIKQARRKKLLVLDDREKPMYTLCKDTVASPRKIDAAMTAVLAWEARGDAIAAGAVWVGEKADPPKPMSEQPREAWEPDRALPEVALVAGFGGSGYDNDAPMGVWS